MRYYFPAPLLFLLICEAFWLLCAIGFGELLRDLGTEPFPSSEGLLLQSGVFAAIMLAVMTAAGLYRRAFRDGLESMLLRLTLSMVVGAGVLSGVLYAFPDLFIRRGVVLIAIGLSFFGLTMIRAFFFRFGGQELLRRRILVLGAHEGVRQFRRLRRKADQISFKLVGYVPVSGKDRAQDKELLIDLNGPLLECVERYDIQEIVVAAGDGGGAKFVDDLLDCKMSGVEVVDIHSFLERELGKITLDMLRPNWLIYSGGFRYGIYQAFGKRLLDIVISALFIALSWPLMLGVALAIRFEDGAGSPVLFRQVRVGENWRLFQMLKFRSMREGSECGGCPRWTSAHDERITRVGRVIRRYRLDELPQLFNVLKGDMSFVGPRPEQPGFVESLTGKIPYYAERHRVKPGLTGWAQVHYPYGASEKDALEKLQYDLYYVKNRTFFLDCLAILYTFEVVFLGKGVR